MSYYLRDIFRSFAILILLEIEEDKSFPGIGESHAGLALAHGYFTLDGIRWRKGDGNKLNGDEFESYHLGGCKLITEEEAQRILVEVEKPIEYKIEWDKKR